MNAPRADNAYQGDTYYGRAALKPSLYGWKIALYTALAGLAGGAQCIAWAAQRSARGRHLPLVRHARLLAAGIGGAAGPALLVSDLKTPARFHHMLRIWRPTSPMSIGSFVLTAFGAVSAFTALPTIAGAKSGRRADWGDRMQAPAALAGAGMMTYTAPFLAATATPLWSATPRGLAVQFAAQGVASGAAALALAARWGEEGEAGALDRIACGATVVVAAASYVNGRARKQADVAAAMQGRWRAMDAAGALLGVALPLACYALDAVRGTSRARSAAAAVGILAGSFLTRWALFEAGKTSAGRPRDYFARASARPRSPP